MKSKFGKVVSTMLLVLVVGTTMVGCSSKEEVAAESSPVGDSGATTADATSQAPITTTSAPADLGASSSGMGR